jgi:hypothetical protein
MLISVVDVFLKVLAAATVWLILWKGADLWAPARLLPRPAAGDAPALDSWLSRRERGLTLLATFASTAPFVGLAGTILHIIKALGALSGSGGDIAVIAGPISQALTATLWGLASAIPSAAFYNVAVRRVQVLENVLRKPQPDAKGE